MQLALILQGMRAAALSAAAATSLPSYAATSLRYSPWLLHTLTSSSASPSSVMSGTARHNMSTVRNAECNGTTTTTATGSGTTTTTTTATDSSNSSSSSGGDGSQLHVSVEPLSGSYEGVSVISLTRPGARNAIGRQLLRELAEALDTVRQERTTRCVLVRSVVPGVFCSGADLKERATMSQSEAAEFVSRIRRTFTELQDLPMPTIAVVEGMALGGGAELALACDLRVMGSGSCLAFPEAQLGIIPGAGGTQRLPRIVGASRAKELIFTGRRVTGEEAARLQLADHVVADEQVYERALQLAEQIVRSAPLSLRQAKAAVNRGLEVDLHTGLAMEEALYAQLLPTRDRLEGLKAFGEKRKPVYTGE